MEANPMTSFSSEAESEGEEEDYISMEVDNVVIVGGGGGSIFCHSTKEFEFQSFSSSSDADHATTSPADELFYMGKLLPLHLPPRLEMVHNINSDECFGTPVFTPTAATPFESCNISPSESCQVSTELNPEEYFLDYLSAFQEKKTWTERPKAAKQSSGIGSKLRWGYFKSLFTKSSGCSNEFSAAASGNQRPLPKAAKQCANGCSKTAAPPFGQIKYKKDSNLGDDGRRGSGKGDHRRSFSGAFKRLSKTKTSSGSSSTAACGSGSNSTHRNLFKRCSSSSWELESPIQAAIAHCKRSQQELYSRRDG